MGIEDALLGSADIRNFLKLYSDPHWNKVCKATMLIGIARLYEVTSRRGKHISHLSLDDLEEWAVAALSKAAIQNSDAVNISKRRQKNASPTRKIGKKPTPMK